MVIFDAAQTAGVRLPRLKLATVRLRFWILSKKEWCVVWLLLYIFFLLPCKVSVHVVKNFVLCKATSFRNP